VKSNVLIAEGEKLETGQTIASLKGNVIDLLALERTILNFLQRLSGIATHTAELVKKANPLVLLDTRKTTPGWRILEKYAVKIGGAKNHRMNLGDLILIKDNHIDASGGVKQVLEKVYKDKPPYMPVEIEIRNTDELIQALEFKPDIIMLDNMTYSEIKKSISLCIETSPNTQIEISGGVNEESFEDLRNAGVKLASLSALISKASTVDISMKISN
ncbi:MAG: carboxylating nicotinate-nucleotide diphosphorylase, partial [Bdellovibrionales bacterium]|nr:carboxylating nicotinate-nucleotide diphosphorylase [Bdellovibrionales bacterium]